jgi:hypothetical protein
MNRRHIMAYGLLALEIIGLAILAYLVFYKHIL